MSSALPHPGVRPVCTQCGQPLSALRAMRSGVCERPPCRQRHDAAEFHAACQETAHQLRQQQQTVLGRDRAERLRVTWIRPHQTRLVELPHTLRDDQQAFLRQLAGSELTAAALPAEPSSLEATPAAVEAHLCGWCGGRCCRYGGENHAYLNASHLRRWQVDHPGSSLDEAAQAYVDRLPARHVEGSCMYHGERGCTLDRTMRSEVCNRYICSGLRDVQARLAEVADDEWLLVMGDRGRAVSLALSSCDGLQAVDLPAADAADRPRSA